MQTCSFPIPRTCQYCNRGQRKYTSVSGAASTPFDCAVCIDARPHPSGVSHIIYVKRELGPTPLHKDSVSMSTIEVSPSDPVIRPSEHSVINNFSIQDATV